MSENTLVDTSKCVIEFMVERGWQEHLCVSCGHTFFSKMSNKPDIITCGWHKCDKGMYQFRAFSKRRKMLTPAEVGLMLQKHFVSAGFGLATPRNIANLDGETDLVVAGVQMFDGVIHRNQVIPEDKVFVAQPCVRMKFQQYVESQEGISTSFVNVCTEKMGGTFDDHLQNLDYWLTALSQLGLHMNDFIVVMRTSDNDWGTGKFSSLEIFLNYGGLELGDAAYMLIPQPKRVSIPISDIGFGLERIAWALNKTNSYFDMLTPWASEGSREMFDSCRTLALLVLCGVQAANKGPGLQFRRFAKVFSEKYYGKDVYNVLAYYFDYWTQFIKPSIDRDAAIRLVRLEIERFINLKVSNTLQLPPPRDETTEAYFDRLVYTCGIDIYKLREAIKTCKK